MTNLTQPSLGGRLRDRAAHEFLYEGALVDTDEPAGAEQTLAHGKSPATPFLLLGTVALFVFAAVAVVTLAAVLVWWLV